jgi:hypothetical protein
MSDYNRTTRECLVSQLHPELRQEIRNYFKEHELGDLEAETIICCETTSEKKSAGGPASWLNDDLDIIVYTGMLLTPNWLIWVRYGDRSGVHLAAANLINISVKEYSSFLTQDNGLEVTGFIEGSKGRLRGNIAMGTEIAAQKFCDEVRQAIAKANPPSKSIWPKWLGG